MSNRSSIEEYPYSVVKSYDGFEIREYEASLFTSVKMATNKYEEASSSGFRVLAGYIFGNNSDSQKIAMTSPVAMTMNDSMTMMFMVPRNLKKDELPKPNDSRITLQEEPAKTVAAIKFSGWANNEKLEIVVSDPGQGDEAPPDKISLPDIEKMLNGEAKLGGMGLYIIQELMDEVAFLPAENGEGNHFYMGCGTPFFEQGIKLFFIDFNSQEK